ncbi:ATP-binding cassette sub-family C member 2-like [Clupea harengus]|uniref:ATP-binding cassette sub-family C member 2-like n=1 Tax=Clupea harengus TaxID=7950 RepID=A0A8M1KLK5_CLUHA|nr:ATP-binding cassette sub-family C member 2-like [Clupea harengus]
MACVRLHKDHAQAGLVNSLDPRSITYGSPLSEGNKREHVSCPDEYCGSSFWNASYLDRADPDLPVCVEQTVLVWVQLGFLWLSSPWHLAALFRGTAPKRHLSRLYVSKQVTGLCFRTPTSLLLCV